MCKYNIRTIAHRQQAILRSLLCSLSWTLWHQLLTVHLLTYQTWWDWYHHSKTEYACLNPSTLFTMFSLFPHVHNLILIFHGEWTKRIHMEKSGYIDLHANVSRPWCWRSPVPQMLSGRLLGGSKDAAVAPGPCRLCFLLFLSSTSLSLFWSLSISPSPSPSNLLPEKKAPEVPAGQLAMSNPCVSLLEVLGLVVGFGGWFCSLAATLMPSWRSLSTELNIMESYESGLWETCVVQEVGGTECRAFDTLLGLSFEIMLARVLMCLSDALSLLGLIIAIPGLKHVRSCKGEEGWRVKRGVKIAAGVLCCIAGIVGLIPVSFAAHDMVMKFFDHSIPEVVPRFEFGDAIFIGWAAGFLHVVAGFLFFASCMGSGPAAQHLVYHRSQNEYLATSERSGKRTEMGLKLIWQTSAIVVLGVLPRNSYSIVTQTGILTPASHMWWWLLAG
ncbi:hypothetical protein NFI96_005798 [Prochilodus magdalenae]|nr:hypothetical protein NFI96_005798 [Prochilodus magdalenae]